MAIDAIILAKHSEEAERALEALSHALEGGVFSAVNVLRQEKFIYVELMQDAIDRTKEKGPANWMDRILSDIQWEEKTESFFLTLDLPFVILNETETDQDITLSEMRDVQGKEELLEHIYMMERLRHQFAGKGGRTDYAIAIGSLLQYAKKALVAQKDEVDQVKQG